jgi:hypothetical protein
MNKGGKTCGLVMFRPIVQELLYIGKFYYVIGTNLKLINQIELKVQLILKTKQTFGSHITPYLSFCSFEKTCT